MQKWEKRLVERPNSWREYQHPWPVSRLTAEQQKMLLEVARRTAAQATSEGRSGWLRSSGTNGGVESTESRAWRRQRDTGFSAQVPMPQALERDWRFICSQAHEEWPRIKLLGISGSGRRDGGKGMPSGRRQGPSSRRRGSSRAPSGTCLATVNHIVTRTPNCPIGKWREYGAGRRTRPRSWPLVSWRVSGKC